jgi:Holliday junction resolvasome RuvABC endonuclease subunit
MSKILGLDVSTYIGCHLIDEIDNNANKSKLIHFKEYKGFKRLTCLEQSIGNLLDEWQPEHVIIEGYALGSKNNLVLMVEVGTLVRRQCYLRGLPYWTVPPNTLKLWTAGKGNAQKPDMAAAVHKKWGFTNKSDDIVDAFALAKMGEAILADPDLVKSLKGVKYENQ